MTPGELRALLAAGPETWKFDANPQGSGMAVLGPWWGWGDSRCEERAEAAAKAAGAVMNRAELLVFLYETAANLVAADDACESVVFAENWIKMQEILAKLAESP